MWLKLLFVALVVTFTGVGASNAYDPSNPGEAFVENTGFVYQLAGRQLAAYCGTTTKLVVRYTATPIGGFGPDGFLRFGMIWSVECVRMEAPLVTVLMPAPAGGRVQTAVGVRPFLPEGAIYQLSAQQLTLNCGASRKLEVIYVAIPTRVAGQEIAFDWHHTVECVPINPRVSQATPGNN